MRFNIDSLPGSHGYGIVYSHGNYYARPRSWKAICSPQNGGTSLRVAAFMDTPRCRKMYDWIKEKGVIVFQSEPEINRITQRLNFFIVFKV